MNNSSFQKNADQIEHHFTTIKNLKFHYLLCGQGPLVVLLHGMAGTGYTWRHVIPGLARTYTVLVPDLRGFGDSDKPLNGYDKRTMAEDIHALLDHLGQHSILLAGHDFGGPIAYALAAAYPNTVRRLAVFESTILLPTASSTLLPWFVAFFQTPEIPEALLKGHEREFFKIWMNQLTINKSAISEEDLDEYARTYALPGAVEAAAGLYRAFPKDMVDNGESSKVKLAMPVLAFGAEHGMKDNTLRSFQTVADRVRGGVISSCGHFVPEERPEFVVEQLLSFFGEKDG